jgi:Viral BACON domain
MGLPSLAHMTGAVKVLTIGILLLWAPVNSFAISTSPAALSFSGTAGSANPPAQAITFWKGGDRTKDWTVSASTPWISVTPSSGTIATEQDQIAVSVNLSGLSAGSYSSSVIILTKGFTGRYVKTKIPIALTVTGSTLSPSIRLSPTALSFSGMAGSTNPAAQLLTVSNPTGGTLSWSLSDNAAWLSLSTASGTTTTETDSISASVNLAGLAAGTYTAAITVTASGAANTPQIIPVSLTVATAPTVAPVIGLSTTSLAFTGTAGGTNPTTQSFTISNTGSGTLTWTTSDTAAWLTLTPASGTNTGTVTATVNLTGLAAGTYSGTITAAATGATSKTLPVSLTVSAPAATPVIGLSTTSLAFTGTAGGTNPTTQSFTISNTGGGTLTWTAGDNAAWLTLSPASGTNTGTITASVNLTGLAAGTYNGNISVAATGATSRTVPVTLTVSAAPTATPVIGLSLASLTYAGTAGGTNPTNQSFTISNTGSGTLTWTAGDSANWLTLSPAAGTNTGTVTAAVNLTGLAAGTYSGTITVAATGATSRTLPVSLTVSSGTTTTNSATLIWGTNTETDLAGYKIYIGTQSGVYGAPIVLGRVNTYQATNLAIGTTYFFSITAYDNAGNESTPSAEVSKSIF